MIPLLLEMKILRRRNPSNVAIPVLDLANNSQNKYKLSQTLWKRNIIVIEYYRKMAIETN